MPKNKGHKAKTPNPGMEDLLPDELQIIDWNPPQKPAKRLKESHAILQDFLVDCDVKQALKTMKFHRREFKLVRKHMDPGLAHNIDYGHKAIVFLLKQIKTIEDENI